MRTRRIHPLVWVAISLLVLVADYMTGPNVQFPILYLLPIMLAAWFNRPAWAFSLAGVMPVFRLYDAVLWHAPLTFFEDALNSAIQIAVFVLVAYLVKRAAIQSRRMEREVHQLEGLLRICSFCKKIRNDDEVWEPLEKYIGDRSQTQFSHGLCPDCARKHYGRYFSGNAGEKAV